MKSCPWPFGQISAIFRGRSPITTTGHTWQGQEAFLRSELNPSGFGVGLFPSGPVSHINSGLVLEGTPLQASAQASTAGRHCPFPSTFGR